MLDGISDIARGIQTSQPGDLAFCQIKEELEAKFSPVRRHELAQPASDRDVQQNIRRVVKLLHKAAIASRHRNWNRSFAMVRLALEAVGRDKQQLRELMKTHDLSFIIIPRRPVARDRHGLVDPRLTMINECQPPRLGFVRR
jgi:hypothetical protein